MVNNGPLPSNYPADVSTMISPLSSTSGGTTSPLTCGIHPTIGGIMMKCGIMANHIQITTDLLYNGRRRAVFFIYSCCDHQCAWAILSGYIPTVPHSSSDPFVGFPLYKFSFPHNLCNYSGIT